MHKKGNDAPIPKVVTLNDTNMGKFETTQYKNKNDDNIIISYNYVADQLYLATNITYGRGSYFLGSELKHTFIIC